MVKVQYFNSGDSMILDFTYNEIPGLYWVEIRRF